VCGQCTPSIDGLALGFYIQARIDLLPKEIRPMAKRKNGVNKSEEIRQMLRANPDMPVKEIVSALGDRGIKVTDTLVYFIKGKMKGRRGRRKKARQMVEKVATTTGNSDAVKTILKVKGWANEVGGMKKLKALVDALSE
jgi:hypothetical protein